MRGLKLVSTMMLVTVMTCSACGPTVVEVTATPTSTPVPPTPTATPTPLPTAKPTPIPVASATPRPGLSTVLVLEDLPPGFQVIPPEEMGLTRDLFGEELVVESTFCFYEAQNFEVILGLTVVLASRLDQLSFDLELTESEALLESFVEGFAQHEPIRDQGELIDVGEIGDASTANFVVSDTEIPLQIDLVGFRRGDVGVFVFSFYIHGYEPVAPIDMVARQMDARILAALPPGD